MQTDYQTPDIIVLQEHFESISSAFDKALKKDVELGELKKIFHEMRILHTRIVELRQSTGIHSGKSKATNS